MTNPPFDTRPEGRADDAPLGVLGGSGLYALDGLTELREEVVDTPFGRPSGPLLQGRLGGRRVVFLARHGAGHRLSPSEINYRANIHALKQAGVERLLSISAVGSLREAVAPGDLVLCDQLIDKTFRRASSFFGEGVVGHVSFAEPMCGAFVGEVAAAAESAGVRRVFRGGTYVCMEGPQFSTRAESLLHRSWGADVVGMTAATEAKLAREAELCFALLALSTDYDCWHPSEEAVTAEAVIAVLEANVARARAVVAALAARVPPARGCGCDRAAARAVLTSRHAVTPEARDRLRILYGRYL
jgi:5'-methylthioadenosine phosphorylase